MIGIASRSLPFLPLPLPFLLPLPSSSSFPYNLIHDANNDKRHEREKEMMREEKWKKKEEEGIFREKFSGEENVQKEQIESAFFLVKISCVCLIEPDANQLPGLLEKLFHSSVSVQLQLVLTFQTAWMRVFQKRSWSVFFISFTDIFWMVIEPCDRMIYLFLSCSRKWIVSQREKRRRRRRMLKAHWIIHPSPSCKGHHSMEGG